MTMLPSHLVRRAGKKPRRPAVEYPPGYFCEPCRAWWGENWQPHDGWGRNEVKASQGGTKARATMIGSGRIAAPVGKALEWTAERYRLLNKGRAA